jgi:hypothetical protein
MYKVVRFYENCNKRVVARGLTLEEAQQHCSDSESSWRTATSKTARTRTRKNGPWFDGFTKE